MVQAAENTDMKSPLEMSDEELMNLDPSTLDQFDQPQPAEATGGEAPEVAEAGEAVEEEEQEESESSEQPAASSAEEVEEQEAEEPAEEQTPATESEAKEEEATPEEAEVATGKEVDYKAEYEKLMKPFKANGRDIQVSSVDDAIALMQMGANYNKKMAALKPNMKLMKMLENNDLLSEEKLNYLIDLSRKDAGAINKLIKESGIDPLTLDTEKAEGYTPKSYKVDEREIELDMVLEQIQHTPAYPKTLEVVSKQWDPASRQVVANSPQLLKIINDHVDRGIYDVIAAEVERERIFGRLNGMSDIEAYRQVGDSIQARGGFDRLVQKRTEQGQQAPTRPVVVQPKPKSADDNKLREMRKAASTSKPASASATPVSDFNPLALSDEDFSKLVQPKFL
jgi:hypothetical protein